MRRIAHHSSTKAKAAIDKVTLQAKKHKKVIYRTKYMAFWLFNLYDWVQDVWVIYTMLSFALTRVDLCQSANSRDVFLPHINRQYIAYITPESEARITNSSVFFNELYNGYTLSYIDDSNQTVVSHIDGVNTLYPSYTKLQLQNYIDLCHSFHRYDTSRECDVDVKDLRCHVTEEPKTHYWFVVLVIASSAIVLLKETAKLIVIVYILVTDEEAHVCHGYIYNEVSLCPSHPPGVDRG